MTEVLLDSSIVIDATNNHPDALDYVNEFLWTNVNAVAIHAFTFAEVIVGTHDARELFRLKRFLRPFRIEYPTVDDWPDALNFLGHLHLSHKVDLPDCLIAATALRLKLPVATVNDRHFRLFKGLKVIRPY
ncbi:MAG: PIN domain-containing protein [Phycisphaerales bacterium]|nr:PIN domain-containing protein [Phycisphaerales bacterium]